ncbi:hypothetical protein DDE83_006350 [Stemphylium lycopersici]|uniref:Uncharacterized protein n=1 Tax=Stemphylium lycopersici TaxID=183478 RepID=A0A364MZ43_STELY|nr:hypothetical protein DDE83_006350 [Stemphylium lycopersici]
MPSHTSERRSPRSPRRPSYHQASSNQPGHSGHRSSQSVPHRSRHNSIASGRTIRSVQSQAGDMKSTGHRSRIGSQASGSGGVLGLPGTIDPSLLDNDFDLTQSNVNGGFLDDAFDLHTLDGVKSDDLGLLNEDFDANQFQYTDLLQEDQAGLDLGLPPTEFEQFGDPKYPFQYYNYGIETGPSPSNLIPIEPYLSQPLNPALDYQPGLDPWLSYLQTTPQLWDTTPGLSALPGGTSLLPEISHYPVAGQPQQIYPDPFGPMYPTAPYFPPTQQQYPQLYTGYLPMPAEQYGSTEQTDSFKQPTSHQSPRAKNQAVVKSTQKRKRSQSDSESEDDGPIVKRPREGRPVKTTASPVSSRNQSLVSDNSSVSKPVKASVLKVGQKPKKCEDKPWVRINNTTKGETTRTARINQHAEEGRKYKIKSLPRNSWESTHHTFEYSKNNGMHELKKRTMSARQIHEYITEYPSDTLRIWIQPVASDSARRYASASHSHCRFEKCPMRKHTGKGTAEVGNYRVAFDEKHRVYGPGVVDPYDCVGYAHLYCMERFLDFAYICEVADVRVDQRVSMEKEPKGHFASAFGSKHYHEAALAKKFIDAASKGRLSDTHEFADYPVHEEYERGVPKDHERTLVYALYGMNIKHRAKSQMKQFILQRTIRPGSFPVHRGDMEVKLVDKKIEMLPEFKAFLKEGSKRDFDYSAYYDDFHPEIKERIAECMALRDQFIAEDDKSSTRKRTQPRKSASPLDSEDEASPPRRTKKRQVVEIESSEDEAPVPVPAPQHTWKKRKFMSEDSHSEPEADFEEIGEEFEPETRRNSLRSRHSPRQKVRIDYTEPQDVLPEIEVYPQSLETALGYQPAQPAQPAEYLDSRNVSCSNLFPANNDTIWGNLDLDSLPLEDNAPYLTQSEIDALLNAANRRKSSTLSNGPFVSAMRSPGLRRAPRRASFNAQPVSSSKEFREWDPPSRVAGERDMRQQQMRRSERLANKA